jgi:hypothetical protein
LAGSTGGTAESTRWNIECPPDQPAIGLYGFIHNYVERVGLICAYGAP